MARTKLSPRAEKLAAARAKRHSKRENGLTPGVRRLIGILPKGAAPEEHRRHLRKKYRP